MVVQSRSRQGLDNYALWLMPSGQAYAELSRLIEKLSSEYKGPSFEPHVTLLSDIRQEEKEVIRQTEKIAESQQPLILTLSGVDHHPSYFRCLFAKVKVTPMLLNLYNRAVLEFGLAGMTEYMPHVSLMYGNVSNKTKEQIIRDLGEIKALQFSATSIHVFRISDDPSRWHRVKEVLVSS